MAQGYDDTADPWMTQRGDGLSDPWTFDDPGWVARQMGTNHNSQPRNLMRFPNDVSMASFSPDTSRGQLSPANVGNRLNLNGDQNVGNNTYGNNAGNRLDSNSSDVSIIQTSITTITEQLSYLMTEARKNTHITDQLNVLMAKSDNNMDMMMKRTDDLKIFVQEHQQETLAMVESAKTAMEELATNMIRDNNEETKALFDSLNDKVKRLTKEIERIERAAGEDKKLLRAEVRAENQRIREEFH